MAMVMDQSKQNDNVLFSDTDLLGRKFNSFYAAKDPAYGPGWYIFGRNEEFGYRRVRRCGTPNATPRKHRNYNIKSIAGWRTKKECEAAIASL